MSRPRTFWYHFNKPESRRRGHPVITVHHAGTCHLVKNVVVNVPTAGRIRKTQPVFVAAGKCKQLVIKDDVAIVG